MNNILDKILKNKVISVVILVIIVIMLGVLLVFNSFKIYEIVIGIGLGLLMNVVGRRAFNKPKTSVQEIILLVIAVTLAMYATSH